MSRTLTADEDKLEAEIASTPNIKLEEFLLDDPVTLPVTDGSALKLDPKSPKELGSVIYTRY